jgi:hypothetical protein
MIEYQVKVYGDGSQYWYLNDVLHREDGPAVEGADGSVEWWLNGELHREGGPALEWINGAKEWWLNGELHRPDGPAVEWANGIEFWYLNGERMTKAEHQAATSQETILTMDEVARLAGVPVERLKIQK